MLTVFLVCALIVLVLEPKLVGALLYWGFIACVGFIAFWALILWMIGA